MRKDNAGFVFGEVPKKMSMVWYIVSDCNGTCGVVLCPALLLSYMSFTTQSPMMVFRLKRCGSVKPHRDFSSESLNNPVIIEVSGAFSSRSAPPQAHPHIRTGTQGAAGLHPVSRGCGFNTLPNNYPPTFLKHVRDVNLETAI